MRVTHAGYDGAGRMVCRTDPSGNRTGYRYDAARRGVPYDWEGASFAGADCSGGDHLVSPAGGYTGTRMSADEQFRNLMERNSPDEAHAGDFRFLDLASTRETDHFQPLTDDHWRELRMRGTTGRLLPGHGHPGSTTPSGHRIHYQTKSLRRLSHVNATGAVTSATHRAHQEADDRNGEHVYRRARTAVPGPETDRRVNV